MSAVDIGSSPEFVAQSTSAAAFSEMPIHRRFRVIAEMAVGGAWVALSYSSVFNEEFPPRTVGGWAVALTSTGVGVGSLLHAGYANQIPVGPNEHQQFDDQIKQIKQVEAV